MSDSERDLSAYCELPSGTTRRLVTGSTVMGACAMSPPVLHPTITAADLSGNDSAKLRVNRQSRSLT
jgi:hypothetical protein